ncbi:hypothetical protein MKW94_027779, partial [Papaver nudicaule]|nr:hypothetical protein [Papaver nudicaule]
MDTEDEHKSVDVDTENFDDYSDGTASEYEEEEMIVDSDQEDFGGDHPEERYTDLIQQADITQVSNSLSIPR